MPSAKPAGVAGGQHRHLVAEHLRVGEQARRDDRPCPSAGTDRSSAACWCPRDRGDTSTSARQQVRGDLARRPFAGEDRHIVRCRRAPRQLARAAICSGCAAGEHEPRVGPRRAGRSPSPRTADRAPDRPRTCRCRAPPASTVAQMQRRARRAAASGRASSSAEPGAFSISTDCALGIDARTVSSVPGRSR